MERNLVFVLAEDHTSPSGGNLYNYFLLQALRKEGLFFKTVNFHQALEHAQKGFPGVYWVDSLYLSCIERLLIRKSPEQDIFLIIHHLPSLEPTQDDHVVTVSAAEEQNILERGTGFLVTSPFTRDILLRRKLLDKPILVVPPALCISPSGKKAEDIGFRGLMVSNLIKRKGILEFIENLGERLLRNDSFEIRIVGRFDIEQHYAKTCLRIVKNHPLLKKSINFLGPLSLEKLQEVYEGSTIFISSSKMETYGMSVHEAKAFGLPVLAYEAGYIKTHIIPGKNGYLYRSISELAQACTELIRTPDKLKQLRNRSYHFRSLENYTWKDAARLFLKQFLDWKGHNASQRFQDHSNS